MEPWAASRRRAAARMSEARSQSTSASASSRVRLRSRSSDKIAVLFIRHLPPLRCWYSGDANAGAAVHFIAPIDPDEDRGQCLGGGGIGERPAVDATRS